MVCSSPRLNLAFTVSILIAATLYFAAAWHELGTRATLYFRNFYIRHGHGFSKSQFAAILCVPRTQKVNTGLLCYRKTCLKHNFLYGLGMARLVVTFPDLLFLVDGEKHLKSIELCILDLEYPKSNKMTSIF